AISILQNAGFKKGPDGIMAKGGQKLSFTIINNGGYSHSVAAVKVIPQGLTAAGTQVTPPKPARTSRRKKGCAPHHPLAYNSETGGPSPYYELRQWLYSGNSAPIGTAAGSNWERYSNSSTDALINQYAATNDAATQHAIVNKLQLVMLKEVPVIPITESVDWYQYDTGSFTGWVTPTNQYALPATVQEPDWGQQMIRLAPKG